jgi:hypothetical protein
VAVCISALTLGGVCALAQSVISARSGLIHYSEGRVLLDDKLVESQFGTFPEVKENKILRTEQGRAEVLLTPGVFLRIGENSSFRMITNRLVDTRLEVLGGSAIVEADDLPKDNAVTVVYKDAAIRVVKKGLYRVDSSPEELWVFDGEALVEAAGRNIDVKEGKVLTLNGEYAMDKFDKATGDALNRWSKRRGEYLSMANVSAAKSLLDSGTTWNSSGWYWNPFYGSYTFIPLRGSLYSPYGFQFWSPVSVYRAYFAPRYSYAGNRGGIYAHPGMTGGGLGGYNRVAQTPTGYSGAMGSPAGVSRGGAPVSAPAASSASAPAARGSVGGPRH